MNFFTARKRRETFFRQFADFAAVVDALHQSHHATGTGGIAIAHSDCIADPPAAAFRQSTADSYFIVRGRIASFITDIAACPGKILA